MTHSHVPLYSLRASDGKPIHVGGKVICAHADGYRVMEVSPDGLRVRIACLYCPYEIWEDADKLTKERIP